MVIGPPTPWQLTVIQWGWRCSQADPVCYLDDDWRCHARTGPGHMTNHEIFVCKTFMSAILYLLRGCCSAEGGQRFWFTITWSFMVQTLKIFTETYTSRIVRGQSTLKDVIERYFWNGLSRERLKAMKALYALYAEYANVLVEKRTLVVKSKIWNLKPNCIYSMQSIEQHYYRETEEHNYNGCKLLVKKDDMLDSLDGKERSYDNSTNGINFTIRKVNLTFVFIVIVWILFFNKCMIQNPVFFVYNVMLFIVYAIFFWANFYVKLLMSSAKAAVNSFDESNVFEKAAQLSVIVYDNKLNKSNDEAFSTSTFCNCRSRYDKFVYFNCPRTRGIRVRDREPSRIPKKKITHIMKKSRKVWRLLRTYIRKSILKSSRMHLFTNKAHEKFMHMESDVRVKEQRNIPLLQWGENIESLTNTGYWKC